MTNVLSDISVRQTAHHDLCFLHFPKVKEVAVIGVKDEVREEVPKAFLLVDGGVTVEDKELRAFCRDKLAGYKVPKHFEVLADLPRTPTGKVLKRLLPIG